MQTADFDYELPGELIAQMPAPKRDESRLLVMRRDTRGIEHRGFRDLTDYLRKGDVLVLNNSRVVPARLRGVNRQTGGVFEVLLLEENATNDWWVMLRPGKRARLGTQIELRETGGKMTGIIGTVVEKNEEGHRRLQFGGTEDIAAQLEDLGEVPLPPYIERAPGKSSALDRDRYQTVFAQPRGSVAAPTAGLHFTESLLAEIRSRDVEICFVTLHVGLGTFAPVKTENIEAHMMHEERYEVSAETAEIIERAKRKGRRVIAVGTTTLRVLESVVRNDTKKASSPLPSPPIPIESGQASEREIGFVPQRERTDIFIWPPYDFKVVDALLTNFHLPKSTLLMLVSAFAAPKGVNGREMILKAYGEAIKLKYRFFSYGDAMLIL